MEGHADGLGDRLALGVAERGREVHPVADDGRVRRADDRRRHLVGDRLERVRDDLERDRIGAVETSATTAPLSSTSVPVARWRRTVQPSGTTTVVSYSSTRHGPAAASEPIEGRDRTGTSVASSPSHIGRFASRSGTSASSTSKEGVSDARTERREPHGPHVHRRAGLAAHAVEHLVLVLESRPQAVREAPVDRPVRQWDLHLPALPAVAKVGGAEPHGRFATSECLHEHRLHLVEKRRDGRRVGGVDVEMARADLVELGAREEQADGAEQPGHGRDEDGRDAELVGKPAGMNGAGAAVGDEREVTRVAALLGRDRPQGPGHAGVRDAVDAVGRLEHGQPERHSRRAATASSASSRWIAI